MIFRPLLIDAIREGLKSETRRLMLPGDEIESREGPGSPGRMTKRLQVRRADGRLRWATGRIYWAQPGRGQFGTLRYTISDIFLERLQAITIEGAVREGISNVNPVWAFGALWNSIHPKPPHRWQDNPLVWVLTITAWYQPEA